MVLPEVTPPKATLTGNDVIGSYVTGTGSYVTGSDRVRMCNRFPRLFLTIVVVQNVPLRMTEVAWLSEVTSSNVSVPLEGWGARLRNRKLRNIHPSGNPNNPVVILRSRWSLH